jgi:hypothetical protein
LAFFSVIKVLLQIADILGRGSMEAAGTVFPEFECFLLEQGEGCLAISDTEGNFTSLQPSPPLLWEEVV